jgi:hypothetical protein
MSTKELILEEIELMSENELAKALKLLQCFGLTNLKPQMTNASYSLRGLPIQYIDPFEPVALDDWEVLK